MNITLPPPKWAIFGTIGIMLLYWIVTPWNMTPNLAIFAGALRAAASTAVVIVYGWSIWQISKETKGEQSHGLIIGIFLASSADIYGSVVGIAWRLAGQPAEWTMSSPWFFGTAMTTVAAMYHIAVPGAIDGRIPRRNIILIGATMGAAGMAAGFLIAASLPPGTLSSFWPF